MRTQFKVTVPNRIHLIEHFYVFLFPSRPTYFASRKRKLSLFESVQKIYSIFIQDDKKNV